METILHIFIVVEVAFVITSLLAALLYPFFVLARDVEEVGLEPLSRRPTVNWHRHLE